MVLDLPKRLKKICTLYFLLDMKIRIVSLVSPHTQIYISEYSLFKIGLILILQRPLPLFRCLSVHSTYTLNTRQRDSLKKSLICAHQCTTICMISSCSRNLREIRFCSDVMRSVYFFVSHCICIRFEFTHISQHSFVAG